MFVLWYSKSGSIMTINIKSIESHAVVSNDFHFPMKTRRHLYKVVKDKFQL